FQRASDQAATLGQFLDLIGYSVIDAGATLGELREVLLHGGGHTAAAFGELPAVVFDGFVDAGAGIGESLDVGVERSRHDVAGGFHAASEVGGTGFEHGGGRRDDVGHVCADLGLALIDHRRQRVLALGKGGGYLACAFDQSL